MHCALRSISSDLLFLEPPRELGSVFYRGERHGVSGAGKPDVGPASLSKEGDGSRAVGSKQLKVGWDLSGVRDGEFLAIFFPGQQDSGGVDLFHVPQIFCDP